MAQLEFSNAFHGTRSVARAHARDGLLWLSQREYATHLRKNCAADCCCGRTVTEGYRLVDVDSDGNVAFAPAERLA